MAARSGRALALMLDFAERTGLTSDRSPERYLWTDAFAVCSLLELGRVDLAESRRRAFSYDPGGAPLETSRNIADT